MRSKSQLSLVFAFVFLLFASPVYAQFSQAQINALTEMINQWLANGQTIGGSGHVIEDEGKPLTQETNLNFTGNGVTASDAGGKTVVTIPGGGAPLFSDLGSATNTTAAMVVGTGAALSVSGTGTITPNYTPSGTIAATTVQGAIAELDSETQTALAGKQGADPELTALANNNTAGFWAAATALPRTFISADTGNLTWTNPAGIAGNPTIGIGPNVALTTRSFTLGNFDFDLGGGASFTMPKATGGSTTIEGRIITNTSTHRAIFGNGTTAKTFAFTDEIQPLNSNLTALSSLTGVSAISPVFTGAGTMSTMQWITCVNSGGNVLHVSSLAGGVPVLTCDASATTGLSGATLNQFLKADSGTTFSSTSDLTRSAGGVIQMPNGIEVGNISNGWTPDGTAYAGHGMVTVAVPYVGAGASFVLSTGALTTGHSLVVGASGQITDSGGTAGTGTWTDSSTNTTTSNKTLIDALAGGGAGNVIKSQLVASFDGGSLTADGTNCQDPVKVTINSGPSQYAILCATPNSAVFDAVIIGLKQAVATIKVRLKANDTVSTKTLDGTFKAQCRATSTAPSATWGTTQVVSITLTTLNTTYENLTPTITPNGTCSAGSDLYLRYNATGGSNSASTRILGLTIEQQS